MKNILTIVAVAALALAAPADAQPGGGPRVAAPADDKGVIILGGAGTDKEIWTNSPPIGLVVRNVTRATLTPVLPKPGTANGTAVIVAPGGAFMMLAMDLEGQKVAQALADRGITAFILKYRTLPTPDADADFMKFAGQKMSTGLGEPGKMPTLQNPVATADGIAAVKAVRAHAAKWGIDPRKVGMIGFSAGAMTALNVSLEASADARPDFIGYIYGPQATIDVPAEAPPMFAAIAFDDMLFKTMGFPLVQSWLAAKRPVELHAYQKGNHGFGLGKQGETTAMLTDEFAAWLSMNGFASTPAAPAKQ